MTHMYLNPHQFLFLASYRPDYLKDSSLNTPFNGYKIVRVKCSRWILITTESRQ